MIARIYNYIMYKGALILRRIRFGRLKNKYGFDEWHMTPRRSKPYIKDVVSYISEHVDADKGYIVDVGCGLCDILSDRRLKAYKKMGVDVSKEVCLADAELYKDFSVKQGSFEVINDMNISCLIALNFSHGIAPDVMTSYFDALIHNNKVEKIVVDVVTGNYTYTHKYEVMLPGYKKTDELVGYKSDGGSRIIEIYSRCR